MPNKEIYSRFGLIGNNLDLRENIFLEINKDGKIVKINYDPPKKDFELSAKNQNFLMIPGLINSHIHIVDNFAKEMGFNRNLIEVVAPPNGLKHKLLKTTSKETKINGIKNAVLEMLSGGITFFIDFRERGVEGINLLKEALKNLPISNLIFGRFTSATEIEQIFKLADGIGLASYKKISPIMKKELRKFKEEYNKQIACHSAEFSRDRRVINEIFHDKIIDIVIHGTKYLKEDLELIKKKNISLVLCPRCNGYFGIGFPPIIDIIKLKIPISLGTDNLMVNNTDLFEEMRYLYRISRVLGKSDKDIKLTSRELLKMVTINAARIFNLNDKIGSISEGKEANFFMIDLNDPNFYSYKLDYNNIYPIIVQRTKSENIKKTFIKGELVFERK